MGKIIHYIKGYIGWLDKKLFLASLLFTAILVFLNYHFRWNVAISHMDLWAALACWTAIFGTAFGIGYLLQGGWKLFRQKDFLLLFTFACLLFAWKMCAPVKFHWTTDVQMNDYLNAVVYWPVKLLAVTALLFAAWKYSAAPIPFYGTARKSFQPAPYLLMLLIMAPLIALASTRPDFLEMYPRYQNIWLLQEEGTSLYKMLFELSYGSDFFTIELFFRGFLVLAFVRWGGQGVILPMAMFYCTIHFGKPLGECISSFFGGLLLGIITYHTRSIWGGLMVHLGIAWMMELAGHWNPPYPP